MLTPYDIEFMENCVSDIISGWNTTISIYKPLPSEEQTNWNPVLQEFNGDVYYDIITDVPAERKDLQNMEQYKYDIVDIARGKTNSTTGAGNKDDGKLLLTIPDEYHIDTQSMVEYDNEMWRVDAIRPRIGETLIIICKYYGAELHVAE